MSSPAWKDAPDVAGTWVVNYLTGPLFCVTLTAATLPNWADYVDNKNRYYGPIPEDKNES